MKKKTLASILSICVLLSVFSGCGNTSSASNSADTDDSSIVSENGKEYIDETQIDAMFTSPDDFKGQYVKLTGMIFATPEYDDEGVYVQMFADPENSANNVIIKYANPNIKLNNGDYISIDGYIKGEFKGENAFGGEVLAPKIVADTLNIVSRNDVIAPTLKEISPNLSTDQSGYVVSVDKIEFAEKETRVYMTVTNNTQAKFYFYDFNVKIIQNGTQYENEYTYDESIQELPGEILPGVSASGEIVFPAIDSTQNFQIYGEGHSDNYDIELQPYTFDIASN